MKLEIKVLLLVSVALLEQVSVARSTPANRNGVNPAEPVDVEAAVNFDVDAAADTEGEDSLDLQSMLDNFKGGSDIQKLVSFLHEYESVKNVLREMITLSPLFHQIVTEGLEKSAKLRILYKVIEGKAPDIKDMYELVTDKDPDSLNTALWRTESRNKGFKRFLALVKDPNLLKSNVKITEISELVIGQKFTVGENVMNLVRGGEYPSNLTNPIELNGLELVFFLAQNYDVIADNIHAVYAPNIDSIKPLEGLASMNTSHLVQITWVPNSKYTVTHQKESKLDPDVAAIMQDIQKGQDLDKTNPGVEAEARQATLDITLRIMSLIARTLKSYKALTNGSGTSVISPGMG